MLAATPLRSEPSVEPSAKTKKIDGLRAGGVHRTTRFGALPTLFAKVSRGRKIGTVLVPHLFRDSRYRVQLGKQGPYIPLADFREIPSYLANGYSLLMSDRNDSRTPRLITPKAVRGWNANSEGFFFHSRSSPFLENPFS